MALRIVLDLQGTHGMSLTSTGVIHELRVTTADPNANGANWQDFSLEGSISALHNFFEAGLSIVEEVKTAEENGEEPPSTVIYFGPEADQLWNEKVFLFWLIDTRSRNLNLRHPLNAEGVTSQP